MWKYLKKAGQWLAVYWYVPLFVVGVVLGFLISARVRGNGPPPEQVAAELKAIKAGAKAHKLELELGAEQAAAQVEAEYHAEAKRLDTEERAEADKLRADPGALARYLVRVGRRRGSGS